MADEIELKLELTPDAADAFEASALLPANPEKIEQGSVYFDTPDHALAKKGFSLRIRRSGRKRTQTVKADGASAAGLFVRSEWERAVKDDKPILDDTTPVRAMIGGAVDSVGSVFEVRIARRTWILRQEGATIEVVLDRGEAAAGDRTSPICEIELELKAGDPAALFTLARRIDAVAPVRLSVQTKAERGYRLTGPVTTMVKAEPIALTSDMTAAQAFQHIVQSCVRQFRLNETLLLTGGDTEALHQARVALRRLRSSFSIFKPLIGGDRKAKLGEELRCLASRLGDARNLDVLLERARSGPLYDRIEAARQAAYGEVADALASSRARKLMLDLAEWTVNGDWLHVSATEADRHQPAREFAVAALGRFRRKVKKGGGDLAHAADAARHRVRKNVKKLRYGAEFFATLFERKHERRRYERFLVALEELQDQLGLLNDLATAPRLLETLGIADDHDASMLLVNARKKALLKAAAVAHDALIDTKRFWR